jgi:predicted DNA-binding transcriptional regulator AlpA
MSSNCQDGCSVSEPVRTFATSEDPVGPLLKISDVCAEIGLSRAMIYRLIQNASNPFPKPIKFGNASRWSLIEIIEWKKKALAARDR